MQRRDFTRGAAATLALLGLQTRAQPADPPLIGAPRIIEALTDKDIVLDRPGQAPRPGAARAREPHIDLQVQFTFDSAELLPHGKRQLDELAMALSHRGLAGWGFLLAGHTDRVGDADYNLRLSHARAAAVKAYLEQAHSVSPGRLQTIGYGFSRLSDPAHPAAAVNRRVEVRRVALTTAARPQGRAPSAPPAARPATGGRLVPTPK
jgi:OmpA-OmpF porin, OOP family